MTDTDNYANVEGDAPALSPIEQLIPDGVATADAVGARPILRSGSEDATHVPDLIRWLNKKAGQSITIGSLVTAEVLAGLKAARSLLGIPLDQSIPDAHEAVGPNDWAAVNNL